MDDKPLNDSGKRTEFETGAQRELAPGKGRFDLLPGTAIAKVMSVTGGKALHPTAIKLLALHFEKGAKKYSERNWEKGLPLWSFLDSGLRHAYKELAGEEDEDHAVALLWNLICYVDTDLAIQSGVKPETLREPLPRLQPTWNDGESNFDTDPCSDKSHDLKRVIALVHAFAGNGRFISIAKAVHALCQYIGARSAEVIHEDVVEAKFGNGDKVNVLGYPDDAYKVKRVCKTEYAGYPFLYVLKNVDVSKHPQQLSKLEPALTKFEARGKLRRGDEMFDKAVMPQDPIIVGSRVTHPELVGDWSLDGTIGGTAYVSRNNRHRKVDIARIELFVPKTQRRGRRNGGKKKKA